MNDSEQVPPQRGNPESDAESRGVGNDGSDIEAADPELIRAARIASKRAESGELQDLSGQIALIEKIVTKVVKENQAIALRAAIGLALVVSAFSAILWAVILFVDASDNPTQAYFSVGITFVALCAGLLLASVFVFKPSLLKPIKNMVALVVNWLKRLRRRRD